MSYIISAIYFGYISKGIHVWGREYKIKGDQPLFELVL